VAERFSKAVHIVERELGFLITEQYLLMKFWNQIEEIKEDKERENGQHDRMSRSIPRR